MDTKKKKKEKGKLWKEFKAFISKGDAFMLAVGVVIGGAFNAIVSSLVNILLSVCTWAVPGGLKGLVSVLPAVNDAQKGMDTAVGLGQKFAASDLWRIYCGRHSDFGRKRQDHHSFQIYASWHYLYL